MCPALSAARGTGASFSVDRCARISLYRLQHMTKMPLAGHNNVVKALPSDRADKSFSKSFFSWGTWRRRSIANTDRSSDEDLAIGSVPVADQIAGSLFPATCFRELICD